MQVESSTSRRSHNSGRKVEPCSLARGVQATCHLSNGFAHNKACAEIHSWCYCSHRKESHVGSTVSKNCRANGAFRKFLTKCIISRIYQDALSCQMILHSQELVSTTLAYSKWKEEEDRLSDYVSCHTGCASRSCIFSWHWCMPQRNQKVSLQKRTSQKMYSDNGTNFQTADNELKKSIKNGTPASSQKPCNRKVFNGTSIHQRVLTWRKLGAADFAQWEKFWILQWKLTFGWIQSPYPAEYSLHTLQCIYIFI